MYQRSNPDVESDSDSYYSDSDIGPEGVNYSKYEQPQCNQNYYNANGGVSNNNMPFFHEIGSIPLPSVSNDNKPKKKLRFFTPGIVTNFPVAQDSILQSTGLPVVDPTHPNYAAAYGLVQFNKRMNERLFK